MEIGVPPAGALATMGGGNEAFGAGMENIKNLPWWIPLLIGAGSGGMTELSPDMLTDGQRQIALGFSFLLLLWGIVAAALHAFGGSGLTWRSGLFGPPKMIPFVALNELAPKWGIPLPRYGAGQNNPYYLEGALQQAAVKGKLRVEGRKCREVRHNDPLVPIPAAHFEDYGFGHGLLGYGATDNEASHTGDIRMMTLGQRGKPDVTYYDLHLSERDARKAIRAFRKDPKIEQS